jgi:1,4-dihydroxy-2-naphthoate octaprenyltransferase
LNLRKNNLTPAELVAIATNFANEISDLKTSEDDEDEFANIRDVPEMSDAEDHISVNLKKKQMTFLEILRLK